MNYDKKYDAAHKWLRYHHGKASLCENPNCPKTCTTFHWALIHGKEHEKKRENYQQLCVKCHFDYDGVIADLAERKWKAVRGRKENVEVRFVSIKEAARILHVSRTAISNVLAGRANTAGGFVWTID